MVKKLHLREKVRAQGIIGEWSLLWPTGGNWTFFIGTRSGAYGEKDAQFEFLTLQENPVSDCPLFAFDKARHFSSTDGAPAPEK